MAHIRKFNEGREDKIRSEIWAHIFVRKSSSGRYWKELFGDDFDKQRFVDRSDALTIIKTAQRDTYTNVLNILEVNGVNQDVIAEVRSEMEMDMEKDNSGLGM
jgi:hypothetical protein